MPQARYPFGAGRKVDFRDRYFLERLALRALLRRVAHALKAAADWPVGFLAAVLVFAVIWLFSLPVVGRGPGFDGINVENNRKTVNTIRQKVSQNQLDSLNISNQGLFSFHVKQNGC